MSRLFLDANIPTYAAGELELWSWSCELGVGSRRGTRRSREASLESVHGLTGKGNHVR